MDSGSARAVALMSIHPRFVDRILEGTKRVEFRKTPFRLPVSHVVIYSTGPVRKVVGLFEVDSVEVDEPHKFWKKYERVSGVEKKEFDDYYDGRTQGAAIRIGKVFRLDTPLALDRAAGLSRPPQSFRYLKPRIIQRLLERVALGSAPARGS